MHRRKNWKKELNKPGIVETFIKVFEDESFECMHCMHALFLNVYKMHNNFVFGTKVSLTLLQENLIILYKVT